MYKELETTEQMNKRKKENAKSVQVWLMKECFAAFFFFFFLISRVFFHLIVLKPSRVMKCLMMISDSVSSSLNKDDRTAVAAARQH